MRGFLLLSLGVFSFSALAADLPGSHDLDVLPRFPRAEIVDFRQAPSEERIYPLGAISRISGRLRMEGEVRAEGELTALTYRLPPEHSSQEAFAAARTALLKADATPLFWCERRDCGSSSLLANAVFGNAKLYGPDEQQAYLLVRLAAPQENSLVAVYSITRGNRRAYLQAEELKADAPLGELLPSPATLLRLLSGLLDAQAGRLLLDDVSLTQIDPADRQRGIGYLPQDVALFHGSLRDNLNLENAALGDEELLETLDGVGLGAFVRGHPLGLDMPIQGNASLSGGQRQAVGLARVLLQDPPILLLDEPTAAFDQGSEKQVIDYLQQWLGKRTLVITTHKKSMLALVERAVVLRQGRVIMDGPLEQVVQGNQVQAPQAAEGGNHGL